MYENVIVATVVCLSVALGIGLYSVRSKVVKDTMLMNELAALRAGIAIYKTVNHANPPELSALFSASFESAGVKRPYADRVLMGPKGELVDPFGKPYQYDMKSGWVFSTSPEYERW